MLYVLGNYGQLCNHLFLAANLISYAINNDEKIYFPSLYKYNKYFNLDSHDKYLKSGNSYTFFDKKIVTYGRYLHWLAKQVGIQTYFITEDQKFELSSLCASRRAKVLIGLYFQDNHNFSNNANAVRTYFEPRKETVEKVDDMFDCVRSRYDKVIGIHVRQGDYVSHRGGMFYYETSEYINVIEELYRYYNKDSTRVCFLLCSNVSQPEHQFCNLPVIISNGSEIEDLYALSKCDLIVGPSSTYSEWASFYGNVPKYDIDYKLTGTDIYGKFVFNTEKQYLVECGFGRYIVKRCVTKNNFLISCRYNTEDKHHV